MSITGPATRFGPRVAEGRPLHEHVLSWRRRLAVATNSPALVMLGIAALALLLRLPNYSSRDLWDDELIQYHISAAPSLAEMFQSLVRSDRNPPGFALLARAALHVSDSDVMLRLPSLLGGMGAVVLAWYAGKSWLGVQGAAIMATITAVCPTYIFFSREARPYSLGLCAVYAYLVSLNAFRQGPSLRRALPLGLLSAAAIGVQYANIPVIGVTLGVTAAVSLLSGQRNSRSLASWGLVAVLAAAAVAINVLLFLVPQVSVHGTGKTDFLHIYFFDLSSLRSACDFIPRSTADFLCHISLTCMMAPGWHTVCLLGWLPLAAGAALVVGWGKRACERRPITVRREVSGFRRQDESREAGPDTSRLKPDAFYGGPALASSLVPPYVRNARLVAVLTLATYAAFLIMAGTGAHPFGAVRHALPLSPLAFLLYAAGLIALHRRGGPWRLAGWMAAALLLTQMGVADAEVLPAYHRFDYSRMKDYVDARRGPKEAVLVAGHWASAKYLHLSGSTETAQPPWYYIPISPVPDLDDLPDLKYLVEFALDEGSGVWVIEVGDAPTDFGMGRLGAVAERHPMMGVRATHWTREKKSVARLLRKRKGSACE